MPTTLIKEKITFDQYGEISSKLEISIGQIIAAERIPKSIGLKLTVVFGENKSDIKTVFTNLGRTMEPEAFIGISCPFITNLEPVEIKGVNSQAMIMVATNDDGTINLNNYEIGSKLM